VLTTASSPDIRVNERTRVLLVDRHPLVRAGARALLQGESEFGVVGEADSPCAAAPLAVTLCADIVVIGLSPADPNHVDDVASLVEALPKARLLAFSAHAEVTFARRLMKAGVAGFALKQAGCEDFIRALKVIVRGGTYIDPSLARALIADVAAPASAQVPEARLSNREAQAIRFVARGFTAKEAAAILRVSPRTLETYRTRAMAKLNLRSRAELLQFALRSGWLCDA